MANAKIVFSDIDPDNWAGPGRPPVEIPQPILGLVAKMAAERDKEARVIFDSDDELRGFIRHVKRAAVGENVSVLVRTFENDDNTATVVMRAVDRRTRTVKPKEAVSA